MCPHLISPNNTTDDQALFVAYLCSMNIPTSKMAAVMENMRRRIVAMVPSMSNLTLSGRATTIRYSPSTYAFHNAWKGWLSTCPVTPPLSPMPPSRLTGQVKKFTSMVSPREMVAAPSSSHLMEGHSLPFRSTKPVW
jgi:hypothetical protein